jgi:hypothetical protein
MSDLSLAIGSAALVLSVNAALRQSIEIITCGIELAFIFYSSQ